MNEGKIISLLGIAKKAGKTVSGTDMTVESVRKKKGLVCLILLANDASANTVKRITNTTQYYSIPLVRMSIGKSELAKIIGSVSEVSVIGITDIGFANAMQNEK